MKHLIIILSIIAITFSGCSGCSKSARIKQAQERNEGTVVPQKSEEKRQRTEDLRQSRATGTNIVTMTRRGGVYEVPVEINGVSMNFIFDSGASSISMSLTEATYLMKQGKLKEEDILGTQRYQIADGSIHEGDVINLRTVKIGNKTLRDVEASVVRNLDAPLLLGQSALERFGKITIDYQKREIVFY